MNQQGFRAFQILCFKKYKRQHFGPPDFCLGGPFITLFLFLKYRNQGSNLGISGSQLDSSSSWHRGMCEDVKNCPIFFSGKKRIFDLTSNEVFKRNISYRVLSKCFFLEHPKGVGQFLLRNCSFHKLPLKASAFVMHLDLKNINICRKPFGSVGFWSPCNALWPGIHPISSFTGVVVKGKFQMDRSCPAAEVLA